MAAAVGAQKSGQFDAAKRFAQDALDLDPTCISTKFLLGVSSARLGEHAVAVSMLRQVLEAEPKSFEALVSLSTVYREIGQWDDAIAIGRRVVEVRPNDPTSHNNLGRSLLASRRLSEAAASFGQAIGLQPNFAAAHHNLGKTRQLEGRDGDAAKSFARAAALAPTLDNLMALGHMLLTLCDYEGAADCAKKCVEFHPNSPAAHLLYCGALTEQGELLEAERYLHRAIELDPEYKEALQTAIRQRPLGFIDEANENLRRALDQNPRLVSAFDALMQNQKATEPDRRLIESMRSVLDQGGLSETELVSLHYGLGKGLEDLKEFEAAMSHYNHANRLTHRIKFGDVLFDETRYQDHVSRLIDCFSSKPHGPITPESSDLPVLIIGMMRSGTSLVEQVLSSHADVVGAGEQLFWTGNWSRALPSGSESLQWTEVERLGAEYVERLRTFGPTSKRMCDKMPGNYMFAGLIQLALPNARFIHIRRNPVDTCLSIWATPNHMPHEGGNDKGNIVFVYKQYLRLMEHWRKTLPPDRLLDVDYEALVTEQERVIRSMVTFCGLEWDDACLSPHKNKRIVATPSAWQVRQPFYGSSVSKWRHFEPWLGEFQELTQLAHPTES